jgi:hypothetical protein
MLDGVCYSLPFYLGDQNDPATIIDILEGRDKLPSYHDLPRTSAAFQKYQGMRTAYPKLITIFVLLYKD